MFSDSLSEIDKSYSMVLDLGLDFIPAVMKHMLVRIISLKRMVIGRIIGGLTNRWFLANFSLMLDSLSEPKKMHQSLAMLSTVVK